MAFVSAARTGQGVDYSEEFDPRQGIIVEFTDTYQIIISNPHDSGKTALSGVTVPQFGNAHPDNSQAFVVGRRATQESHRKYNASIRYSTRLTESMHETNPLLQPVQRRWASARELKIAVKDRDGNVVLNKAQVQYDPPLEVPRPQATLTFVRNEASFSGAAALQYVGRVNAASFSGAAPGTLICDDIQAEESFFNGQSYWTVTYIFQYDPDGWQPRVLEQSLIELGDDNGWYRIKDEDDEPVDQPVPIDANGKAIDSGLLPDAAISTVWNVLEEANFASLGLPA